jgi:hypothetical protein
MALPLKILSKMYASPFPALCMNAPTIAVDSLMSTEYPTLLCAVLDGMPQGDACRSLQIAALRDAIKGHCADIGSTE